jgi:hypothetical protein
MFGAESIYAARYAGLGLCLNLHPQLALWATGIIASFAGSAVWRIAETPGYELLVPKVFRINQALGAAPDLSAAEFKMTHYGSFQPLRLCCVQMPRCWLTEGCARAVIPTTLAMQLPVLLLFLFLYRFQDSLLCIFIVDAREHCIQFDHVR